MSRKNVVGNHIHVIYYEERGERERGDRIKVCANFYFSAFNEKTEHNFFYTTHENVKTLF